MSKSKNKSLEKSQGFDWEQLGEKGKRDATIKEGVELIKEKYTHILSNGEDPITEEQLTNKLLPEVEDELGTLFEKYELDPANQDRRTENILNEVIDYYTSYIKTETYAEFSIDAVQIYNILSALKNIVFEVEFTLTQDHIALRFMDPTRINLVRIFITAKTYKFFREGKVCVDLDYFAKVVKANASEKSLTTFKFTPTKILITKESEIPLDQFMTSPISKGSKNDLQPLPEELRKYGPVKQIDLGKKTYFVSLRNDLLPELLCARTIAYFKYKDVWCKVKHPDTLREVFKIFQDIEAPKSQN